MPKLLLLDGHSLAYRAFYALPSDLATKAGTVTNAVFGFTSMLTKVLADEKPDYIAVAFDAPGGSTYRYELDAEYKAGRKETPDLFASQLPLIHEVLDALEIPQLEVSGVEADDVIATPRDRAADEGIDVVVVTGDRDSFQLVRDPHIKVLYNRRGVSDYALYDEAGIAERYRGVDAARSTPSTRRCAATRATTSPACPGIGEKTAAKLITTYGDLEGDLRAPRRAPAEAAPEPRRGPRPRAQEPRDVAASTCDVDCGVELERARSRARSTPSRCASSSTSSSSGRCCPRLLEAVGEVAAEAAGRRGARRRGRDRPRRRGRGRSTVLRAADEARDASRSSRAGRGARVGDRSSRLAVARPTTTSPTSTPRCCATTDGARRARRARRAASPAARRAPREGADARARRRRAVARSTTPR